MGRSDLERLSREELIELVLRLQRPAKTSRTSSKPPATDRKEGREQSKPGGAKLGHEGHSRALSDDPDSPSSSTVPRRAHAAAPACTLLLSAGFEYSRIVGIENSLIGSLA